jgi:hypothetical protein
MFSLRDLLSFASLALGLIICMEIEDAAFTVD